MGSRYNICLTSRNPSALSSVNTDKCVLAYLHDKVMKYRGTSKGIDDRNTYI